MATRILIIDDQGVPLFGLDGHHGGAHAASWVETMLQRLAEQGVQAAAVELFPEQGGDDVRRGVIGELHRCRIELHKRPDGACELVGLARFKPLDPAARKAAHVGAGRGLSLAQAAGVADPIRGALRLVAGGPRFAGGRHAVRVERGRHGPPIPFSTARIERKRAQSQRRGSP